MIKFDIKKVIAVKIDKVKPNTWNPKGRDTEDFKKIVKGIQLKGQRMPIVVREKEGYYEILDGEQRWTACKKLGFKEVLIYNEGQVSDKEAKELTIWYQQQVPFDDAKLADLVKDLSQYDGLELPFSDTEMDDLLNMASFSFDNITNEGSFEIPDSEFATLNIRMLKTQYDIVKQAIDKIKKNFKDDNPNINEARALELICGDYLAS
jgi:hypothetical protein